MIRKFLTLDGDVLEESEWSPSPEDKCFYCETVFTSITTFFESICWDSLDGRHDWITLVNPSNRR